MKAPDSFYIYGFCKGLYNGPRNKLSLNKPVLESNPIKIRFYELSIYTSVDITQAQVILDFDKESLLQKHPNAYAIKFSCEAGIYFNESVFEDVKFIREQITESFFIDPKISDVVKKGKNEFTYGSIEGWGYFKIGFEKKKRKEVKPITKTTSIVEHDFTVNISGSDPTHYHESNGAIYAETSWGTGPYLFSIDNGKTYQTSNTFNKLANGNYRVIAKDGNGNLAYSDTISLNKKSNAGCLPTIFSGSSLMLLPLFGISWLWGIPLFFLMFFLLKLLFRSSSGLTKTDSYLMANSNGLRKSGCTWPAILIILFLTLLTKFCTQIFDDKTQAKVTNTEKEERSFLDNSNNEDNSRFIQESETVVFNPENDVDTNINSKPDSILINNKLRPLKYSNDFRLIIYDFEEEDEDAVKIRLNNQDLLINQIVSNNPLEIKLPEFKSGRNYIDIIPTSNGLYGECTPKVLITHKGKILFEETIVSNVNTISRLNFINNL